MDELETSVTRTAAWMRGKLRRRLAGWSLLALAVTAAGSVSLWVLAGGRVGGSGTVFRRIPSDFMSIDCALRVYWMENHCVPSTEQGLGALVARPAGDPVPSDWVPLMTRVPLDPWGIAYGYRSPGRGGASWEILSAGRDGAFGTADDLSSADELWDSRT